MEASFFISLKGNIKLSQRRNFLWAMRNECLMEYEYVQT